MITNPLDPDERPKPYATAGAGELTSLLWKRLKADGNAFYEFNLFRIRAGTKLPTGSLNQKHLRSMVKLVHLLATVMLDDGCLTAAEEFELETLVTALELIVFRNNRGV